MLSTSCYGARSGSKESHSWLWKLRFDSSCSTLTSTPQLWLKGCLKQHLMNSSACLLSTCVTLSCLSFDSAASCHDNSIRLTSRKLKIPHNTFQQNVAHSCQIVWKHFLQAVQGYESTQHHISGCAPNSKYYCFLVMAYMLMCCKSNWLKMSPRHHELFVIKLESGATSKIIR